jgi:hypothetical protein
VLLWLVLRLKVPAVTDIHGDLGDRRGKPDAIRGDLT